MKTRSILLTLLSILLLAASATAKAPMTKSIYVQITLGKNQKGQVLEYTRATQNAQGQFVYDAKINGMTRTVTYTMNATARSISVRIDGGTAPLELITTLVSNEQVKEVRYNLVLRYNGQQIGSALDLKPETDVLLTAPTLASVDGYSMDVLLHLPTEFNPIGPQSLFGSDGGSGDDVQANSIFKKLWKLLTGGFKYNRDCETTSTGPIYKCDAVCAQAPGSSPGECACSLCGPICCSNGCTVTEGTTHKNCSATVSVGS